MVRWNEPARASRAVSAAALALALLGAQAPGRTRAAGAIHDPVHIPAGVCDDLGTVSCLRMPDGGMEAIDLTTGRSLWRSAAPARALLVARGQAFVLEERAGRRLRMAMYDARRGRLARAYDLATLVLPAWASLAEPVEEREWTVFRAAARLEGDTFEIGYEATRSRASGFALPGVIARVQGVARLSLASGRVEARDGPGPSAPPVSEPVPSMPGRRLVSVHARAADAMIVLGGPPPNVDGALVDGSRRSVFELSQDTRVVTVHRWSVPGRKPLPPIRLEHGRRTDAVWVTLDSRHVLLRRSDEQRFYDVYSLEAGAPLGTLEGPVDVAVVGSRICWTARAADGGLEFRATDVASGRLVWRRTVREAEGDPGPPIP